MATGNDILAYTGNKALGFGGAGTEAVADTSSVDAAVVAGFNNVIAQGMQQNLQKYNQAIRDRDETLKLATEQDIDVPVLDEDRPLLEARANKVKEVLLKNPDIKNNKKAYLEVQKEIAAFNEEKAAAKTRQVEVMKLRQEAAANTDPEFRKAVANHIQTEIGKGIKHLPTPYMQQTVVDDSIFPKVPAITTDGQVRNANGLMVRDSITETPLKSFDSAFDLKSLNAKQANELVNFADRAATNPTFMTDAVINPINAKIDSINARTGENRPHIATKDDQGNWIPNPNKLEFAKAFSIYRDYQYSPKTVADKDMQKAALTLAQQQTQKSVQNKNNAAAENSRAAAGLNKAKVGTEFAHAKLFEAQAAEAKRKGDVASFKVAQEKAKGAKPVDDAVSAFYNINQTNKFQSINEAPAVMQEALAGIDVKPTDQITAVTGTYSTTAKKMLSHAGAKGGYSVPSAVYLVRDANGTLNSSRLVGYFPAKDGNPASTKIVNASEGLNNLISAETGYGKGATAINQQNASLAVIRDLQGEDAAGIDLEAIVAKQAPISPAQPATTTAQAGTIPMGDAKPKKVDGKWSIMVDGKYRKITKQNSKTGVYYYE